MPETALPDIEEATPCEIALTHLLRAETYLKQARESMGEEYTERLSILEAWTESLAERASSIVREQQKEEG